jgi:hypothetical protein
MPWKKGQSGNPSGGNFSKEKVFADALRMVAHETDEPSGKKKIRRIAERLVECALNGEGWAIAQVADRLDGKPAQESTVNINDKRDATDWTRAELVAILDDAKAGRKRTAKANGGDREPDQIH